MLCVNSKLWHNFEMQCIVDTNFSRFRFDEIRMQSTVSTNADISSLQTRIRANPLATRSGYLTKQVTFGLFVLLKITKIRHNDRGERSSLGNAVGSPARVTTFLILRTKTAKNRFLRSNCTKLALATGH